MRRTLLLMPWLLLATVVAPLAARDIEYKEFTLKNGLHVILHQDNSTPIVAVTIMYHVGAKNEQPDRTGFAHFFEHLLFEGSKHMGRGDFDKHIKGAGGANNANTTNDRTFYYEILPSNQLELGLWLESERMLHAKIRQEGVDTQREVVKEERRQRVDNQPYGSLLEEILKRSFREHPYRWSTIGSLDHLNAATLDEFLGFYEEFYVPENAVLTIAGDIDYKDTKKLVRKYFGSIPRGDGDIYRPDIVEPPLGGEVRDVVYDQIQLPAVVMAYRSPAQGTADFYALEMLSTLLSRGESSRLNKEVKDKKQKALFIGAFPLPMEDPGISIMFGVTSVGVTPEDLEGAIQAEIERVKTELISEQEMQKLRNQIENDFVSQNGSIAGIAENLSTYHMFFGDADLINEELDRYMKVTREDLRRVAKQYLADDNRVVLYYLPESQKEQEGP